MLYLLLACAPASDDTSGDALAIVTTIHDYDCDGSVLSWREGDAPVALGDPVSALAWERLDTDPAAWVALALDVVTGAPFDVACDGETAGRVVYACTGC